MSANGPANEAIMASATTQLTWDEFLALPDDDDVERLLINGELLEKPMTKRNPVHCKTMSKLTYFLEDWLQRQPEPRGELFVGEVGCLLSQDPDTGFGIDLAYRAPDGTAQVSADGKTLVGPPALAVEILSPSNDIEEIEEKKRSYLDHGVKLVWVVNPYSKIVIAYRPDAHPELFNVDENLGADVLPGFSAPVAKLFS
jgi:Uma2 family endonuclease